jgi:hypothetical protein
LLAAHRDFEDQENGECSLCSMQKTLEDAIASSLTTAKQHADGVGKSLRDHVAGLVDVEMPAVVQERVKPEALKPFIE